MSDKLLVKNNNFQTLQEMFRLKNKFNIIAGPCSIESEEQIEIIAKKLIEHNIKFIRGGAFKPRTSPHDFQGLGIEGIKLLHHICKKYSLLSVSEITDVRDVEESMKYIDIIQIGSRNMQNTDLLKEVGKTKHPVLLKRGMMSTLKEFLLAAEYIVSNGNTEIVLCERGIRTFETSTRNTLDISSIAIAKKETSLPVIVDLSHSLGRKDILIPVARAMVALESDGIMLEVHNNPAKALSDIEQQLSLGEFQEFCNSMLPYIIDSID